MMHLVCQRLTQIHIHMSTCFDYHMYMKHNGKCHSWKILVNRIIYLVMHHHHDKLHFKIVYYFKLRVHVHVKF